MFSTEQKAIIQTKITAAELAVANYEANIAQLKAAQIDTANQESSLIEAKITLDRYKKIFG